MASWCPATPFEEEIVSLQPEHNFIYGHLNDLENQRQDFQPRPRNHLEYLENKTKVKNESASGDSNKAFDLPSGSLNLIRSIHEITGTKEMGLDANINDWQTRENVEKETIAMIRHCGMGPSTDLPLNKELTFPTLPIPKRQYVHKNGKTLFPVLLDDKEFEVVSTRMRNAEIAKKILSENPDNHSANKNKEKEIKPLLTEDDECETFEKFEEREAKEFLAQFPALGSKKKAKKPSKKKAVDKPVDNWRKNSSSSSNLSFSKSVNTSLDSSSSSYFSFNQTLSDSFRSADDMLDKN